VKFETEEEFNGTGNVAIASELRFVRICLIAEMIDADLGTEALVVSDSRVLPHVKALKSF